MFDCWHWKQFPWDMNLVMRSRLWMLMVGPYIITICSDRAQQGRRGAEAGGVEGFRIAAGGQDSSAGGSGGLRSKGNFKSHQSSWPLLCQGTVHWAGRRRAHRNSQCRLFLCCPINPTYSFSFSNIWNKTLKKCWFLVKSPTFKVKCYISWKIVTLFTFTFRPRQ